MLRNSRQLTDLIDNMKTQWNKGDMKRRRRSKMRKCRSRAPIHLAKLFNCCLPGSRFGHKPRIVPRDQKVAWVYNNLGKGFVLQNFHSKRGSEKQRSSAHQPPPATKKYSKLVKMDKGRVSKRCLSGCLVPTVSKKKGENMKEGKSNTLDGRWRKANRS